MENPLIKNRFFSSFSIFTSLFVFSAFLVALLRRLLRPLVDHDLWWHLSAGREMIQKGALLNTDLFSHSRYGAEWINFEWLGQIFVYLFFHFGNYYGVYFWKILFSLLALGLLVLVLYQTTRSAYGTLLLSWVGTLLLYPRLTERIELFTFLFFSITLSFLLFGKKASLPKKKKIPWILFLLMILWTNVHGGFLYGLVLLFSFSLGGYVSKENKENQKILDRAFVLGFLATLLNPYGPKIYLVFLEASYFLSQNPTMITEYIPPTLKNSPVFWGTVVLSLCVCVYRGFKGNKTSLFWAPSILAFSYIGARYIRATPFIAFVALPFFGMLFRETFLKQKKQTIVFMWALAVHAIVLIWALIKINQPSPLPFRSVVYNPYYPAKACDFIERVHLKGNLYNSFNWGGYLYWRLGPKRKILMDGRYLFMEIVLEDIGLNHQLKDKPFHHSWDAFFKKHGIEYSIEQIRKVSYQIPAPGLTFQMSRYNLIYPRNKWALVYWDDQTLLFVKRNSVNNSVISNHEFKYLRPYNLDQMQYLIKNDLVRIEDLKEELNRHFKQVGPTYTHTKLTKMLSHIRQPI